MTTLKQILTRPVDIERLRTLLPENSHAILYTTLQNHKSGRRKLFENLNSLIVLYEGMIDKKKQGHFICLIPRAHSIEYFSSLGRAPSDELNSLHEDPTAFKNLLGKNFTYNRKRLQIDRYNINDCAFWCIARASLWKLKISEFQRLFRPRSLTSSDEILSLMSLLTANR